MTPSKAALVGFVVSLSMGVVQMACSVSSCDCPPPPDAPPEQSLPLTVAVRYQSDGNTAEDPLLWQEGTITAEAESLTVEYQTPEGTYLVTYALQDGFGY